MISNIERDTRGHLSLAWPSFIAFRRATESHLSRGRSLNERDVRAVTEQLFLGVLGYGPDQVDREPDYADFLILYRGLKLMVIETKDWGAFKRQEALDEALRQAASYADRHRARYIVATDAVRVVLARRAGDRIEVLFDLDVSGEAMPEDLFFLTHYGTDKISRPPAAILTCPKDVPLKGDFKRHHKVDLHYTCFAYVGDLRDKSTWKMPYRNPDGSVDSGRLNKAVGYLLSPSGYRGATASERSVPEAAQPGAARRLALAYKELDQWQAGSPLKAVRTLWAYLEGRGETDLR